MYFFSHLQLNRNYYHILNSSPYYGRHPHRRVNGETPDRVDAVSHRTCLPPFKVHAREQKESTHEQIIRFFSFIVGR